MFMPWWFQFWTLQYHAFLATRKIYPFSRNKNRRKQIFTVCAPKEFVGLGLFFSLSLNNFFEMFKIGMHVEEGLYGNPVPRAGASKRSFLINSSPSRGWAHQRFFISVMHRVISLLFIFIIRSLSFPVSISILSHLSSDPRGGDPGEHVGRQFSWKVVVPKNL